MPKKGNVSIPPLIAAGIKLTYFHGTAAQANRFTVKTLLTVQEICLN